MKRWMVAIASMGLLLGVQAGVLVSSDGAWSSAGVIGSSNGGAQTNQNAGGAFGNYGGPSFNVNAESIVMDMQATVSNMLPVYTEGYTYNYKASSAAANVSMATNQVVYLLANGGTVAGSRVSGPNNTGIYGNLDRPTISGSYAVAAGDALIGQTIGVRLSSEGVQSRFAADGSSGLSAVLTDHYGWNGDGVIYSTSFETNNSGLIATDHVLDMTLAGVALRDGFISLNVNDTGGRNTSTFASAEDTWRTGTVYTVTFEAKKSIESDPGQTDLSIALGSFSTNLTVGTTRATYSIEVDADALGIAGDSLSVVIEPLGTPVTSVNQYQLYDFEISAPPPPPVHQGILFQTEFETNATGLVSTGNVGLELTQGIINEAADNSIRFNLNGTSYNNALLENASDTFHAGTVYTFTFDANKAISSDGAQNEFGFILGGVHTQTVVISSATITEFTFDVDADALGLTGQPLTIEMLPLGTTTAVNQYRIYNLEITAPDIDAFVMTADPGNLIANGGFSTVTDTNGAPLASGGYNIEGTFGDFSAYWGAVAEVTGWAPYYDDPNGLRLRVGNVHSNDLGADILDGTFYLDTLVNAGNDTVTLNSSMDYKNGLVQTDLFNGLTVKAGATYQFSVDAYQSSPGTDQSSATFTAALTADSTDTADAVGSAISLAATNLPTAGGTLQTNAISGVDLLAALAGGPVNVIFEQVNTEAIAGYPASADAKDASQVSQVRIADISLILNIPELDLNKDGVLDSDDVAHLNSYLDGSIDGGPSAEARQNALIAQGYSAAEALAYLNLTDYDFNGDETFDAADVTAYQALLAEEEDVVINGITVDGSGNVTVEVGGLLPGKVYFLKRDASLTIAPAFEDIADSVLAGDVSAILTDTNAPSGAAFYRVTD